MRLQLGHTVPSSCPQTRRSKAIGTVARLAAATGGAPNQSPVTPIRLVNRGTTGAIPQAIRGDGIASTLSSTAIADEAQPHINLAEEQVRVTMHIEYAHVCICGCAHVMRMCICVRVRVCINVCVCVSRVSVCVYSCVYMRVWVCVLMCVC